jgi:hypothetical protein
MKPGAIAGVVVAIGAVAALMRELPEIRRYLKIESM